MKGPWLSAPTSAIYKFNELPLHVSAKHKPGNQHYFPTILRYWYKVTIQLQ